MDAEASYLANHGLNSRAPKVPIPIFKDQNDSKKYHELVKCVNVIKLQLINLLKFKKENLHSPMFELATSKRTN